jgi:hypothetical protein
MNGSDSPESTLSVLSLPDDVLHVVILKLNFLEKINAGIVCKQWEHLLSSGTVSARHWIVNYKVDSILSSKAFTTQDQKCSTEDPIMVIGRYATVLGPFPNTSS